MANYGYTAIDKTGKVKKGTVEADNMERAAMMLKGEGLTVSDISEQSMLTKDINFEIGGKPSARDFSIFCRQMVSMLGAGVTIIDSLNMLAEQTENKRLAKAIKNVQTNVEKGETLGDSMRGEKIFPDLLLSMVDAGEASGSLEIALERMAIQFEKDAKTVALIKKALIYPIVICIVAIAVVCVMLVVVIPSYTDMFNDLGTELPGITKAVVAASDFVTTKWYIIILVVGVAAALIVWFARTSVGEHFFGKLGLIMPLFGDLTIKSAAARFARTMSTLLAAGIPLVDAVDIVADTLGNVLLKEAMKNCKEEIIQGVPLSQPLEACGLYPPMVYHMTRIGEEAGDIEGLLEKLADYYEDEVEIATQSLMAAMEPMIIIVLAGVVGILIGAVMAPMLTMYQSLDNL